MISNGISCNITHDINVGGQVAFREGEIVIVEDVSPNRERPEYKYVVTSQNLQRKFQLSDRDLSEYFNQQTPMQLRIPEREFLIIITKKSLSRINAEFWSNHVGALSEEVTKLIQLGLIKVAGTREEMMGGFRVQDLKPLLKERGLKVSGKKDDLVDRLLGSLTEADAERLTSGIDFYTLTEEGLRVVKDHLQEKELANRNA